VINPLGPVAEALNSRSVRYVLIGVYGANLYAPGGQSVFITDDADLFLPLDADNLVRAWNACDACGLDLWLGSEPLQLDLALAMTGFDFETVWKERRLFLVQGVELTVARLQHIIRSKHATGRDKDRLFLATHRDALEQLLKRDPD
jgi:hypothetical protein